MKEPETCWTHSRSEFEEALVKVISLARHQMIMYDKSYQDWPLENKEFSALLSRVFARMKETAQIGQVTTPITMLVQDTQWLEKSAPRWSRMRRIYPNFIAVKQVPSEFAGNDSLVIVDQQHAVIRPHKDAFRAKTIIAQPSEIENRLAKLKQLSELSTLCLPTTTLGL